MKMHQKSIRSFYGWNELWLRAKRDDWTKTWKTGLLYDENPINISGIQCYKSHHEPFYRKAWSYNVRLSLVSKISVYFRFFKPQTKFLPQFVFEYVFDDKLSNGLSEWIPCYLAPCKGRAFWGPSFIFILLTPGIYQSHFHNFLGHLLLIISSKSQGCQGRNVAHEHLWEEIYRRISSAAFFLMTIAKNCSIL